MRRALFPIALLAALVLLCACAPVQLSIPDEGVARIDVASLPDSRDYIRVYTSPEKKAAVTDYLNGLSLRDDFPEDPSEYCGMSYVIVISYADGSQRTLYHFGNMFIREDGCDWLRMTYDEAQELDDIIYDNSSD